MSFDFNGARVKLEEFHIEFFRQVSAGGLCRSLPFECLSWSVIELRVYKYIVQALCERYHVDLVESII